MNLPVNKITIDAFFRSAHHGVVTVANLDRFLLKMPLDSTHARTITLCRDEWLSRHPGCPRIAGLAELMLARAYGQTSEGDVRLRPQSELAYRKVA